jgi:hypothetical protein
VQKTLVSRSFSHCSYGLLKVLRTKTWVGWHWSMAYYCILCSYIRIRKCYFQWLLSTTFGSLYIHANKKSKKKFSFGFKFDHQHSFFSYIHKCFYFSFKLLSLLRHLKLWLVHIRGVAFLQAFQILILWTCSLYLEKEGAFVYDWLIQKAMLGCFHSFIIYLLFYFILFLLQLVTIMLLVDSKSYQMKYKLL